MTRKTINPASRIGALAEGETIPERRTPAKRGRIEQRVVLDGAGTGGYPLFMKIQAVVAGHICLDVLPDFGTAPVADLAAIFRPGGLSEVGPATLATGGTVSNTGLTLHKLGIPVRLIGKVGNDDFGGIVRRIISSYGRRMAGGIIADESSATSYSIIISRPGLDRTFLHHPGANDVFRASDVPAECLSETRLFHFGYPPIMTSMFARNGRELTALFRRAKKAGATTSLDMSLPDPDSASGRADWPAILRAVLPWVDVFQPSFEEILFMLRREAYDRMRKRSGGTGFMIPAGSALLSDLSRDLLEMGAKIVVLKLGERGLYLRTADRSAIESMGRARPPEASCWADREMWAPCFRVHVAGTTGGGDAAIAGFLAGLLRGLSPAATLTGAAAVGACCVESPDALSGILPWKKTLDRIAGGWPRLDLPVSSTGWRRDEDHMVWIRDSSAAT